MKVNGNENKLTTIKGSWQGMKIRSPILVILINGDENYILLPTKSTSNYEGQSSG